MSRLLFAGLFTEGATDNRFLESVVKKTLDDVAFECDGDIETELTVISIEKTGLGFVEQVLCASQSGINNYGISMLCVHTNADELTDERIFRTKIEPTLLELTKVSENDYCKLMVAVIPVQMIEAWMLADTELLKREMGTTKSNHELGLHRDPEVISSPKFVIEQAIRIARENITRRRRGNLTISELYLPIGQKIKLKQLESLPSYLKFKAALRDAFIKLNYLH